MIIFDALLILWATAATIAAVWLYYDAQTWRRTAERLDRALDYMTDRMRAELQRRKDLQRERERSRD